MQLFITTAADLEVVKELLPLGDALIGAVVTLLTAGFTYLIGRRRQTAEVSNLQAEKKSIEAAAGMSHAEASQTLSEAAAMAVQPLIDRIKDQKEEITYLTERLVEKRKLLDEQRTTHARISAENELLKAKFRLQGEVPPELPPEVKDV